MSSLVVVGAGGHGAVVAEAAELTGQWSSVEFVDDVKPVGSAVHCWRIRSSVDAFLATPVDNIDVAIAIGDSSVRLQLAARAAQSGFRMPAIVHPAAVVSEMANLGDGAVVLAGAVVNIGAIVGQVAIVNTAASVDHDCQIGDGAHIAPGAHLAAAVVVGAATWVGIGASVKQGVELGARCVIGAGAAVISDWPDNSRIAGVPARPLSLQAS